MQENANKNQNVIFANSRHDSSKYFMAVGSPCDPVSDRSAEVSAGTRERIYLYKGFVRDIRIYFENVINTSTAMGNMVSSIIELGSIKRNKNDFFPGIGDTKI